MQLGFSATISREVFEFELFDQDNGRSSPLLSMAESDRYIILALGVIRPSANNQSAAQVALNSYVGGGVDALARLTGEFALVLLDIPAGHLFALRDPMGGFPLYWRSRPGGFALDTSLRRLRESHGQDDLDPRYLGAFLCASEAHNQELNTKLTPYRHIERVSPGHCIDFDLGKNLVRHFVSWDWERQVQGVGIRDKGEALQGLQGLLDRVIVTYSKEQVAAHLSGGMDSTGICALASRRLAKEGGDGRLHTLSLIYHSFPALLGETRAIEAALAKLECNSHILSADCLRPFDNLDRVPIHDEPMPASLWSMADREMIVTAAAAGCRVVLSGAGADFLFDAPPFYLADHLVLGRFRRLLADATSCAEGENASLRAVLWHQALMPLVRGLPARACRGSIYRREWSKYDGQKPPPWMRPDFLRAQTPADHVNEENCCPSWSRRSQATLALVKAQHGDFSRWYFGVPRGINVGYPYLDPHLVAFAIACLERLPPEPSRLKPLLADALGSILPDQVVLRRQKADYNDPFFTGLRDNLQYLERLVESTSLADLGVLEPSILLDCLRKTALGIAPSAPATNRLSKSLALALWLETQATSPPKALVRMRDRRDLTGLNEGPHATL